MKYNGTEYDESVKNMSFDEFFALHVSLRKFANDNEGVPLTDEARLAAVKCEYEAVTGKKLKTKKTEAAE